MERIDIDDEVKYCEDKLKHIDLEYNNFMTTDCPKIREKELFFIREIARLKWLKTKKKQVTYSLVILTDNLKIEETFTKYIQNGRRI